MVDGKDTEVAGGSEVLTTERGAVDASLQWYLWGGDREGLLSWNQSGARSSMVNHDGGRSRAREGKESVYSQTDFKNTEVTPYYSVCKGEVSVPGSVSRSCEPLPLHLFPRHSSNSPERACVRTIDDKSDTCQLSEVHSQADRSVVGDGGNRAAVSDFGRSCGCRRPDDGSISPTAAFSRKPSEDLHCKQNLLGDEDSQARLCERYNSDISRGTLTREWSRNTECSQLRGWKQDSREKQDRRSLKNSSLVSPRPEVLSGEVSTNQTATSHLSHSHSSNQTAGRQDTVSWISWEDTGHSRACSSLGDTTVTLDPFTNVSNISFRMGDDKDLGEEQEGAGDRPGPCDASSINWQSINSNPQIINCDLQSINPGSQGINSDAQSFNSDPQTISSDPQSISGDPQSMKSDPRSINPAPQNIKNDAENIDPQGIMPGRQSRHSAPSINSDTQIINTDPQCISPDSEIIHNDPQITNSDLRSSNSEDTPLLKPCECICCAGALCICTDEEIEEHISEVQLTTSLTMDALIQSDENLDPSDTATDRPKSQVRDAANRNSAGGDSTSSSASSAGEREQGTEQVMECERETILVYKKDSETKAYVEGGLRCLRLQQDQRIEEKGIVSWKIEAKDGETYNIKQSCYAVFSNEDNKNGETKDEEVYKIKQSSQTSGLLREMYGASQTSETTLEVDSVPLTSTTFAETLEDSSVSLTSTTVAETLEDSVSLTIATVAETLEDSSVSLTSTIFAETLEDSNVSLTSATVAETLEDSNVSLTSATVAETLEDSSVSLTSATVAETLEDGNVSLTSTTFAETLEDSSVSLTSATVAEIQEDSSVPITSATVAETLEDSSVLLTSTTVAETLEDSSVSLTSATVAETLENSSVPLTSTTFAETLEDSSVPLTSATFAETLEDSSVPLTSTTFAETLEDSSVRLTSATVAETQEACRMESINLTSPQKQDGEISATIQTSLMTQLAGQEFETTQRGTVVQRHGENNGTRPQTLTQDYGVGRTSAVTDRLSWSQGSEISATAHMADQSEGTSHRSEMTNTPNQSPGTGLISEMMHTADQSQGSRYTSEMTDTADQSQGSKYTSEMTDTADQSQGSKYTSEMTDTADQSQGSKYTSEMTDTADQSQGSKYTSEMTDTADQSQRSKYTSEMTDTVPGIQVYIRNDRHSGPLGASCISAVAPGTSREPDCDTCTLGVSRPPFTDCPTGNSFGSGVGWKSLSDPVEKADVQRQGKTIFIFLYLFMLFNGKTVMQKRWLNVDSCVKAQTCTQPVFVRKGLSHVRKTSIAF